MNLKKRKTELFPCKHFVDELITHSSAKFFRDKVQLAEDFTAVVAEPICVS
jgi:hypothetical protein